MSDDTTMTDERSARRRVFGDKAIETWKQFRPGRKRFTVRHPVRVGHYIEVHPSGLRSFKVQARDPATGRQVWHVVGHFGRMTDKEAAVEGDKIIARIKQGLPPVEPPPPKPDTLAFIARDWLKRYVIPKGLRTGREIERKLDRYILPRLGDRPLVEIKRKQVIELLNKIADEHGPRQADTCKTVLASMANWYRDEVNEDYVPPFGRIKRRSTAAPRDRVLDHDELRAIWAVASAEDAGPFAAIVKLCLLTGQRKQKVVAMRHSDIIDGVVVNTVHEEIVDGVITKTMRRKTFDGVWRIPQAPREKDSGGDLVLPQLALDVLAKQPRHATNGYVFPAHSGPGHLHAALTQIKRRFDAQLPSGFKPWRVHDLRRTARSLMSEAGVDRDIAERVLGHRVGGGVERTYDRHAYLAEKGEALAKLAAHIGIILAGPADNVPLRPASSS